MARKAGKARAEAWAEGWVGGALEAVRAVEEMVAEGQGEDRMAACTCSTGRC